MSEFVPKGGFIDYYELLGVEFGAQVAQIRKSFLKLAKEHHPDAGGSTEHMQLLNHAYKTLAGQLSRPAYDKLYRLHNMHDEDLELRDDYDSRLKGVPLSKDEYVDYFVDSLYAEYYDTSGDTPKKTGLWSSLRQKIMR